MVKEMTQPSLIVISYARADGENLAFEIRRFLEEHGLSCRLDHTDLKGGEDWRRQFESWVRQATHLVLVLTPAALASPTCAWEWRLARSIGRSVVPVRELPYGFPAAGLRRWMRQAHQYDFSIPEERENLLAVFAALPEPLRVPDMADFAELSRHVERPALMKELLSALLDAQAEARPVILGLRGAAGYGKTELAARVAQDPSVREAYFGGVLYVKLGDQPVDLREKFNSLINALSGIHTDRAFKSVQEARDAFATAMQDRHCLMVLDDAWRRSHVEAFLPQRSRAPGPIASENAPLNPNLSVLVTTRDLRVLPPGTREVVVKEMVPAEAVHMLLRGLDPTTVSPLSAELSALALKRFGRWPLLLELANGYLAHRQQSKEPLPQILRDLDEALRADGLDRTMEFEAAADGRRRLKATLDISINLLGPEDAALYRQLSIFSLESLATVDSAAQLWDVSKARARTLCSQLDRLSLLRHYSGGNGTLQLHMALRDVLAEAVGHEALARLHRRFAEAWQAESGGDWRTVRDDYALRHLPMHLAIAGRSEALRDLLLDPRWMTAKLRGPGVQALLSDYRADALNGDDELVLVGRTLNLAAVPLARSPDELSGQLLGRLTALDAAEVIKCRNQARNIARPGSLLPLRPTFTPAGPEVRRMSSAHRGGVLCVAALRDGRLASGGKDKVLRLWDPSTGERLADVTDHKFHVTCLATLPDGRLISGGRDGQLILWEVSDTPVKIASWLVPATLWGPCLGILPTGQVVCMGIHYSGTITIIDPNSTNVRHIQSNPICMETLSISLLPQGRLVTGDATGVIRLWDLDTGRELRSHNADTYVGCLGVLVDSWIIIPGGPRTYGCRFIWDPSDGSRHFHSNADADADSSILVLPNNSVIFGRTDGTLRHCVEGRELGRLVGHVGHVTCVEKLEDNKIVSGGEDGTLRVWDLSIKAREDDNRLKNSSRITVIRSDGEKLNISDNICLNENIVALGILDDGDLISGGSDGSASVWDATAGFRTLKLIDSSGHGFRDTHPISGKVSVLENRQVVVGKIGDLILWDLDQYIEAQRWRAHEAMRPSPSHQYFVGVSCIASLPTGEILSGGFDGFLRIWSAFRGERPLSAFRETCAWETKEAGVVTCAVTLRDGRVATGSARGSICLWDFVARSKLLKTLHPDGACVSSLIEIKGDRLVSGDATGAMMVWNLADMAHVGTWPGHEGPVIELGNFDDDKFLSCGEDGSIRLWDSTDGHRLSVLTLDAAVTALVVLPDRRIAVGDKLGRLHLLELAL